MEQTFVNTILPKLGLQHLIKMQKPLLWFTYDREGDAFHVIFEEAKKTDKASLSKDDMIITKRGKKIINLTILNASRLFN